MVLSPPRPEQIGTFLLAFTRVAGLVFAAPVLGNRNIPAQVRILFSLLLTMVLLPLLPAAPVAPESAGFLPAMISEVLLGAFLGFVGTLLFAAAELGGHLAGYPMGFAIANVLSAETERQTSVLSSLFALTALLTFVLSDAHHLFLAALLKSFRSLPLGGFAVNGGATSSLIRLSTGIFSFGFALAAPVLAVTLFITVAMGILSRSMPQIDVFFMGFVVNTGAGIFMLFLSIPFFLAAIQRLIEILDGELHAILRIAG
ncbi:MAG: flagellar biosynthetic protein FliR [Deltaproteobacteria bacterium]